MIPALFALMLVAEATPQHDVAATEAPAAVQEKKAEKKICRSDDSATGSRMRKKICLTQTQWDQRKAGKSAADLKTIGAR